MLIAENSLDLRSKYGKHTVYTDGDIWYLEACHLLRLKHYSHSSLYKSLIERVYQYFKGRTENFDEYSVYQKLL